MKIKNYLLNKKIELKKLKILPREIKVKETPLINILIGPRRAGKSFLLFDFIKRKKLKEEDYLIFNFEEFLGELGNPLDIIKTHIEIYGKEPKYLFFDEIQALKNWEKFVYYLYESKKYIIFLTGSNSKLLSKEIATQLRGRTLTTNVFPLSFREFLNWKGVEIKKHFSTYEKSLMLKMVREFLKGSLPEIVINENVDFVNYYKSILDLVIFKDVIERHNVKNYYIVEFLIKSLINSVSKEFSINKAYKFLKSKNLKISNTTLYSYYSILKEIFFFFEVKKFDFSFRARESFNPKIYLVDNGFLIFSDNPFNKAIFMENVVFLELKRRENVNPFQEIYYYKTKNGKEIDFLVKDRDKLELIEVCYEFDEEHKKKLIKAMKELGLKESLCITWDEENEIEEKGFRIKLVPLWKWLLCVE